MKLSQETLRDIILEELTLNLYSSSQEELEFIADQIMEKLEDRGLLLDMPEFSPLDLDEDEEDDYEESSYDSDEDEESSP